MKKSLPIKSKAHEKKLKQIADIIVKKGNNQIAFVILFGSFARGDFVYDYYRENGVMYEYASDYDILIVTKTKKYVTISNSIRLINRIEKEFTKQGLDKEPLDKNHSISLIVESVDRFNSELEKSQYFFSDIKKEGILFYDSGDFELSEPKKLDREERRKIAREDYEQWINNAEEFLIDCKNAFNRKSYKKAAFELHQATESLYNCTLLTFTGYKPKLHDLKALGKRVCALDSKFLTIFPQATEEQKECFNLLRAAYIDARYEKSYKISKSHLEYLIGRVEKLKELVEKVCQSAQ